MVLSQSKEVIFIFLSVILCLLICLGIFGNSLVIVAVKKKRSLRSTTNILLANVAASDILTLVFLPLMSFQGLINQDGLIADLMCKIFVDFHIPATGYAALILTLSLLAIERYHAVVKPMKNGIRLQNETVRYAVIAVWLIAVILTLPTYIFCVFNANKDTSFESYTRSRLFQQARIHQ
ncbi:type-1 angiotensin II receptor B-like [Actinia tenebrosa]|uniref:Type-1 angiotensin II receptor B-like n=1 Tax=Actinia tenebrosa TaxID=6105 RepID=A0A6P8I3E9_ACTTE|nr:type-1 angiotensin II receptor B-like [Actinia tenebrosa]